MSGSLALANFGQKLCAQRLELSCLIDWRGLRTVTRLKNFVPISGDSNSRFRGITRDATTRCNYSRISGGPIVPMGELESSVAFQSSFSLRLDYSLSRITAVDRQSSNDLPGEDDPAETPRSGSQPNRRLRAYFSSSNVRLAAASSFSFSLLTFG